MHFGRKFLSHGFEDIPGSGGMSLNGLRLERIKELLKVSDPLIRGSSPEDNPFYKVSLQSWAAGTACRYGSLGNYILKAASELRFPNEEICIRVTNGFDEEEANLATRAAKFIDCSTESSRRIGVIVSNLRMLTLAESGLRGG